MRVPHPLRGYSGVLGDRRFRRFFGARAVSAIGDAAVPTALALSTIDDGHSTAQLGVLLTAAMLPRALFTLPGGMLADRLPKRRLLLAAWLSCGAAQTLSALLFLNHSAFGWIVFFQACYGACASASYPATFGYLPHTVERDSLGAANALISSWVGMASLAGPGLTALCAAAGSPAYALLIDGASFLGGACVLLTLPDAGRATGKPAPGLTALREGWAALRAIPWLLRVNIVDGLLLMLTVAPVMVLGPALVAHLSHDAWILMMVAFAVGELTGGLASGRLRTRHPVLVAAAGLLLLGPPPLVLALGGGLGPLCVTEACAGVGYTAYVVLAGTAMQKAASPEHRSKIGALSAVGSCTLLPLGYSLAPFAAAHLGARSVLWAAAAWSLLSVALLVSSSAVRGVTAEPAQQATPALQPQTGAP